MPVRIKRIYEPPSASDGYRVLVDRLWPRGIKKENAKIDGWLKEVSPSTALRKWFNHEPEKWEAFIEKYYAELNNEPNASGALKELQSIIRKHKQVTLLYGAKDETHNQAAALLQVMKRL